MCERAIHVAKCALLAGSLVSAGCVSKVEVGRYEERGPSVTHHSDGTVTSDSGGRTFRLLTVEKQDGDR